MVVYRTGKQKLPALLEPDPRTGTMLLLPSSIGQSTPLESPLLCYSLLYYLEAVTLTELAARLALSKLQRFSREELVVATYLYHGVSWCPFLVDTLTEQ